MTSYRLPRTSSPRLDRACPRQRCGCRRRVRTRRASGARSRLTALLALAAIVTGGCSGEFPSTGSQIQSAKERADLESLRRSLESIRAWHASNETGLASSLRPGLSTAELEAELPFGKCSLSGELRTIWSWRDGERAELPFVWYHDFLPLEDAKSEYRWLLLNPLVRWDPEYLPILSFEGEWYGAYCGSSAGESGPVIHYFLEDGARVTATNLTTFMAMMAEVFESGAVEWVKGGMVERIGQVRAIHRQYNPGLAFPYHVPDGE